MASEVVDKRRWQLNIRSFSAGLTHLNETKEYADLVFIVGPNKREFKAHRLFVAARSPQLWNIVTREGDVLPPMSKIHLPDVSENAFEIVLNYINTGVIMKMECQNLVLDVYQMAFTYGQKKLQEECERLIRKWDINCENVIPTLQMTDVKFVHDRCWEFLRMRARDVLQSDGIKTALAETLVRIFEKGYFTGIPTMELLTNVVGWAENHRIRGNGFEDNKKKSYKEVRKELLVPHGETSKCLMSWIGFQNLEPEEVSNASTEYPELLTDKEFMIFVSRKYAAGDKKPALPEWV